MSTSFSLTAGQFITQALRKIGALDSGGVPTPDQYNTGMISFNAMLKGWQTDGINLFRQTQLSLTIPALAGYPGNPVSITPLIMGFEEGRWVISPTPNLSERPLGVFTYVDYMTLPNKQAQSTSGPSVVMFDRQEAVSNLYIWPIPTYGGTLNCTVGRTINDVNNVNDPVDFPSEWTEGGIYSLADRLADDEGQAIGDPQTLERVSQRAIAFYEKLLNFDRPTSVMIRPWGKRGSGKFWR